MEKRNLNQDRTVYVRPISVGDLPPDIQEKLTGLKTIYAICDNEGTQLALVNEEKLAFDVARINDYEPFTVN